MDKIKRVDFTVMEAEGDNDTRVVLQLGAFYMHDEVISSRVECTRTGRTGVIIAVSPAPGKTHLVCHVEADDGTVWQQTLICLRFIDNDND